MVIGIDVDKRQLALSLKDGRARLANEPLALSKWAATLSPDTLVGVEATGRYHRPLLRVLHERGITTYQLNPMHVARYIKSLSPSVKTDRSDAVLIARYVRNEHDLLIPYKMPAAEIQQLKDLLSYRDTVLEKRTALRQSFSEQTFKLPSQDKLLAEFTNHVKEIDKLIVKLAKRSAMYERLLTIDGIGPMGAAALTWLFQAFTFVDSDQAVSFTGMDLVVRESGRYKGQRKLTKRGPAFVRTFLFNGANSLRKLVELKPLFEHHAAKRLSTTEVNIVVARKLLRIAFAIATKPEATFQRANLLPQLKEPKPKNVKTT